MAFCPRKLRGFWLGLLPANTNYPTRYRGGACLFHDHSDIICWKPDDSIMCPYAQEAPWGFKAVADEAAKEFQEEEQGK